MRVSLFVTCLVDQFWPSIGTGAVQVLENAGCEVAFDERQTCCGQPAFNSGYRHEARALAERFIEIFEDANADAIVCPSGSCTAMVHHFHDLFPDDERWRKRAESIASRTYEFTSFLVNQLGVEDTGASFRGRVTWHDACHGLRDLGLKKEPRALIRNVRGADFVEMPNADSCCGFGGTFSVKYPEISVAILDSKVDAIIDAGVRAVVSADASCLMQIGGRLSRRNSDVKTMHIAELLAARETI
jgi:L-lactate dehydrogenase complex protein LldE